MKSHNHIEVNFDEVIEQSINQTNNASISSICQFNSDTGGEAGQKITVIVFIFSLIALIGFNFLIFLRFDFKKSYLVKIFYLFVLFVLIPISFHVGEALMKEIGWSDYIDNIEFMNYIYWKSQWFLSYNILINTVFILISTFLIKFFIHLPNSYFYKFINPRRRRRSVLNRNKINIKIAAKIITFLRDNIRDG